MQVCTSIQTDNHASIIPHHSVFYRPDALPAAQPTASEHWRQIKANMSIKLKRQEECEQIRTAATATEKMKRCLIFSREIFYVTIVLCLNIMWLKAINEIPAGQTRTSLCKHDAIKVCSIEYLTTQIELVLPNFFQLLHFVLCFVFALCFILVYGTTAVWQFVINEYVMLC